VKFMSNIHGGMK